MQALIYRMRSTRILTAISPAPFDAGERPSSAAEALQHGRIPSAVGASITTSRWSPTIRAAAPMLRACGGSCAGPAYARRRIGWRLRSVACRRAARERAVESRAARTFATRAESLPRLQPKRSSPRSNGIDRSCSSMRAPPIALRARMRASTASRDTFPAPATCRSRETLTARAVSCRPLRYAAAGRRCSERAPPASELVSMCGSGVTACHNLLGARDRRLERRATLPRLLERVDPRSSAALRNARAGARLMA